MINIKNRSAPDIIFSDRFERKLQEVPDEIKAAFADTLEMFNEEPNHPTLRNHPLKEKFAGFRSINVTADVRALFKESKVADFSVMHLLVAFMRPPG
jgi:mRNA-degrading endonuclease YafQ of YafQ-DinJ toxin-antitoxin module